QADIDAGSVINTAFASSGSTTSPIDTATALAEQRPQFALHKSASPASYSTVGQQLSYTYVLTNTSNVTLSGPFTVADDNTTVDCPATASLAPGQVLPCTAAYTVTQADLDAGVVINHATASATFAGSPVTSNE